MRLRPLERGGQPSSSELVIAEGVVNGVDSAGTQKGGPAGPEKRLVARERLDILAILQRYDKRKKKKEKKGKKDGMEGLYVDFNNLAARDEVEETPEFRKF